MTRRTLPALCGPLLSLSLVLAAAGCGSDRPQAEAEPAAAPADTAGQDVPEPIEDDGRMPEAAHDEYGNPEVWAMAAQIGAAMQALAEACGDRDAARVDEAARARLLAEQDIEPARFDAVWDWAYRQSRAKIAEQPQSELERGCAELRQMQEEAERMEQMMQQMVPPPGD